MPRKFHVLFGATMAIGFAFCLWSQETVPVKPRHGGTRMTVDTTVSDQSTAVMDRVLIELAAWRTAAAEQILNSAQAKYAGTSAYETALGGLKFNQKKLPEASDLLASAATLDPANPAAPYYRGVVLKVQKKHDAADDAWRAARDRAKAKITANPKDARSQFYLGAARVQLKDSGGARQALNAAATQGFDPRMVNLQLGISYILDKNWDAAKAAFDAVIGADDRFAPAFFFRGVVWSKLGRNDKMAEDLEQFLLLAPGSPDADTARVLLSGYQG